MMRRLFCIVLLSCLQAIDSRACVTQNKPDNYGSSISVQIQGEGVSTNDVQTGINMWDMCPQSGNGFPPVVFNGFGTQTMFIQYGGANSGGDFCAQQSYTFTADGRIASSTVTVYDGAVLSGAAVDCRPVRAETIAHEIGHFLGLGHSDCSGYVMSPPFQGARSVRAAECSQVADQWDTPPEQQQEQCQASCWTTCQNGTCPNWTIITDGTCCSPVIVDLDDDGFHLTDASEGVVFDIDADGAPDRISWTASTSGDSFLALDRNGNGVIDNGSELFGTATPLHSGGPAPNGYVALLDYDESAAGGDGDRLISAADAIWDFLRIWTDSNHDGMSQASELVSLDQAGIISIDTRYTRSNHTDRFGNVFRFKAKALIRGKHRAHPSTTYDGFFVKQ